jgi:hypothetical protein
MEKYNKQIMIRITKQDFDAFVRRHNPECFTEKQINQWVLANQELIQKSETDELNDIEKSEVKRFEDEFSSFTKVEVVSASQDILSKGIQYDTYYIREQQIEWDMEKGENEEIIKSSHGRYKDTPHNRKMGRVGAEFGHKKEEESVSDEDRRMIEAGKQMMGKEGKPEEKKEDERDFQKDDPITFKGQKAHFHSYTENGGAKIWINGERFSLNKDQLKALEDENNVSPKKKEEDKPMRPSEKAAKEYDSMSQEDKFKFWSSVYPDSAGATIKDKVEMSKKSFSDFNSAMKREIMSALEKKAAGRSMSWRNTSQFF